MNTKDFPHLGVPLGQAARRATDFISKFIPGGGRRALNPYFTFSRLNVKCGYHD